MAEAESPCEARVLTLDAFRKEQEDFMRNALIDINELYKKKIKDRLVSKAFGYTEKLALRTATNMIDLKDELYENAESDSDIDGKDETDEVNKINYQYQELISTSFLLIRAPRHKKAHNLSIEEDDKARQWQYEHFCELHPALQEDSPKSERKDCSVLTYCEMIEEIESFFEEYAYRSIQAVIVFNGHGGKEGLSLEGLDNELSEIIPLDNVLSDIQSILDGWRPKLTLPQRLEVIYAQCYGHLFTDLERCDMTIQTFTHGQRLKTPYLIRKDPLTRDVVDANHPFLEAFAENVEFDAKKEQVILEETETMVRNNSSLQDIATDTEGNYPNQSDSTSSFSTAVGGNLSSTRLSEDVVDGSLNSISQISTDSSLSREISANSLSDDKPVFMIEEDVNDFEQRISDIQLKESSVQVTEEPSSSDSAYASVQDSSTKSDSSDRDNATRFFLSDRSNIQDNPQEKNVLQCIGSGDGNTRESTAKISETIQIVNLDLWDDN